MESSSNLLDYLKSKTQVDADAYTELLKPQHADLLKKTAALANEIKGHYHTVNFEELAMELSMLSLALSIAPKITGAILVMVNPLYCYSTPKIIDNGQRLYRLCKFLEPGFDLSRLIIKVPSTWEGLQACRKLKSFNVKTLATTLYSMEQAILAAEAGCIYISPFLNELKATFDSAYHDPTPIFDIIVNAQRYYEHHSYPTRVKACAAVTTEQILQLAGVHAFTAPADQLRELASMEESAVKVAQRSRFRDELAIGHTNENANETANGATNGATNGAVDGTTNGDAHRDSNRTTNGNTNEMMEKLSFIDDESKFRLAFSRADEGKAQLKTAQALNLFCEFQIKAEALMRDNDMTKIG
ncbi:MAG: hypothetical protein LQ343_004428 [Gyalolechia ehrenbergii]|nr:MAG: hypothetical protein LQ343_004428 [Gyalolechia ehrenbergii]